jgi:hypothetical protein
MLSGMYWPLFQRSLLPPSSRQWVSLHPDSGGNRFVRNVGHYLLGYTMPHTRNSHLHTCYCENPKENLYVCMYVYIYVCVCVFFSWKFLQWYLISENIVLYNLALKTCPYLKIKILARILFSSSRLLDMSVQWKCALHVSCLVQFSLEVSCTLIEIFYGN